MVLERGIVREHIKELDRILQELTKYRDVTPETLQADLSQRWIIERGLIAAASVIFEIADHVLAGQFGYYAETYEGSLEGLRDNRVISETLYDQMRGLEGFRNILVHRHIDTDAHEVADSLVKGFRVFSQFANEILSWLDGLDEEGKTCSTGSANN